MGFVGIQMGKRSYTGEEGIKKAHELSEKNGGYCWCEITAHNGIGNRVFRVEQISSVYIESGIPYLQFLCPDRMGAISLCGWNITEEQDFPVDHFEVEGEIIKSKLIAGELANIGYDLTIVGKNGEVFDKNNIRIIELPHKETNNISQNPFFPPEYRVVTTEDAYFITYHGTKYNLV